MKLSIHIAQSIVAAFLFATSGPSMAQLYRCGNEYTNNPGDAKARGCRPIEGGNVAITGALEEATNGSKTIVPVRSDGHYYLLGRINSVPIRFLVDTGATTVSVTERFAQNAGLYGGKQIMFHTASGDVPQRVLRDVTVEVEGFVAHNIAVSVGFQSENEFDGLLGQSFLSKFKVTMDGNKMIIERKTKK